MRSGKKLMAVLLVFAMMVTVIPESIFAQTSVPEETFITMTAEQILHHTTTEKEYYAFSPQTSGWYDLCMTDDSTNTFTSGVYETIYYTTDNGEKTEHTKEYYQYQKNSASHSEHLMWLNQEEVYVFYCVPAAYEDPDTIDIALSITPVEIAGMEAAKAPTESSTGDFIGTGMQVKISYQNGKDSTISDVSCDYQVTAEGNGYAVNRLEALTWSDIAYQKNASVKNLINVSTIDGNTDTDFTQLDNGEHTAGLSITYTEGKRSSAYEFSTTFVKSDAAIESISVVQKKDSYTQWFSEHLEDAVLKVTYNDGTKDATIQADAYGSVSGARQYLSYESELPDGTKETMQTASIDEYLKNGGTVGEAEVTVAYQGKTVTYPIQINANPYQGITEVKPARTIYYADAGYADGKYQYAGDSINAYQAGKITLSRTDGTDAETFDNLLCVPGGGDYFDYGLKLGDKLYRNIDSYLSAGGKTGEQQLAVSYLSTQTSATVEIRENPYTRIEILNKPDKLEYTYAAYGTKIDFSGLVFAAYKADGTYDAYAYNDAASATGIENWKRFFHSPYENKPYFFEEGTYTIPVIFMNQKAEYEITVAKKQDSGDKYRSFQITKEPDRTVYYVNEKDSAVNNCFSEEGLELEAVDADGVTKKYKMWYYPTEEEQKETGYSSWSDVFMLVDVDSSAIDWSKAGTYPVTVTLEKKKAVFDITIADTPVKSFEFLSMPFKQTYYRYEGSAMDLNGMAYQITFDDGSIFADTITDKSSDMRFEYQGRLYQIKKSWSRTNSSGNPTIRDDNAILFSVFGQTYATDAISIKEDPVSSIEFLEKPEKTVYVGETNSVDLYGSKFCITYTDQSMEEVSVTEHVSTIEAGKYQKTLRGSIDYLAAEGSDVLQKHIKVSYMNQSAVLLVESDYLNDGVNSLTENRWDQGVLTENKPYLAERFTPKQTKEYYFYCIDREDNNMGSQPYFIEVYADGKSIYRMQYSNLTRGLGINLEAGVTYDYVVSLMAGRKEGICQCTISSDVSDMTALGEPQIEILQAGQTIWYEDEMDIPQLVLAGTTYRKTYTNGWTIEKTITSNMPMINVEQKPLSVAFKYTQEETGNQPQIRDDNALVYSYQDSVIKEIPVQLNVPANIASITIDHNPFENCCRYEIESSLKTLKGLTVTIHFKDEREAETFTWNSQTDTPYLDGKAITAMLMAGGDDYSLIIRYRGVTKEEKITFNEAPVTGFEVQKQPEKSGFYAFENVGIPDLYGMELLVHYSDGTTKTVKAAAHTNRCQIEDGYTGVLQGQIRTETAQNGRKALYISYLGYTEKVMEYEELPFPMETAKKLEIGETNYIVAGDDQPYAFFFVTAETDSHYTVQLGGKVSRYLCRYDEKGNQMDKSYGSSSSICEVTFDLSAGETTYLVAALNETKKAVSLTCKAKGTEIEKEEAKSVEVAMGDLVAGSKFPEADASKMTNYSIKSATWYGDADEDNNVDFATAHRLKLVLAPSVGVAFTENTQVYFNGTLVTEKEIGSNGMLTIYHTFPYTDCKITFPDISGYTLHTEGMTEADRISYGGTCSFYYENADGIRLTDSIVKQNQRPLTTDENGFYTLTDVKENIVITVKERDTQVGENESRLLFYNKSNTICDTMVGTLDKTIADNTEGNTCLPELESYTDDTMQFFYGWYTQKDDNFNGIHTRFTRNTKLTEKQHDLYAKWGSGIFSMVTGGVKVEYKVLSFDDENHMRIQVFKVSEAAEDSKETIEATGAGTEVLEIPESLSEQEISLTESLGIDIADCVVDSIAPYAFADCEFLNQVVLPDTITSISDETFAGAKNLKITLSDAVTKISDTAFADAEGTTVICSSSLAEDEQIKNALSDSGVTLQTVDLIVSDGVNEKTFTYGDKPEAFTVKTLVNGAEDKEADISFLYEDTDAYAYSADKNTLTVTPKRATKAAEQFRVCIREEDSKIKKTITFQTAKAAQMVTAKDLLKNTGNVAFSVGAKTNGDGKLHYTSSDPSVAAVDAYGIVRIYKEGIITIAVTAEETDNYFASDVKYITLTIEPLKAETGNRQESDKDGLYVYQAFYKKAYKSKAFRLNISSVLPVSYTSNNKKVAVVKPDGTVTVKKCGVALITVRTLKAENAVLIQVVPRKSKAKTASKKAGTLKVSWSKQTEASGYLVECSLDKNFKKKVLKKVIKKNKTTSTTFQKLKKGRKYYVRVRAYTVIDNKKIYGDAGKIMRQKIKK